MTTKVKKKAEAKAKTEAKEEIKEETPIKKTEVEETRKIKRQRLDGVAYDRISGVSCPACKMQAGSLPGGSVTNTLPWEDGLRVRYHVCRRCGTRFKSIETE